MKHTTKKVIIASIIALLLAVGAIVYYVVAKDGGIIPSEKNPQTTEIEDKPVGEVNYDQPSSEQENPPLDNLPTTPTSPNENQGKSINAFISYAGGSPLQVRVVINEILASGTCSLSLTRNGTVVHTETVDVFPASSSTTCKGFTVDTSSFKQGAYTATITVKSNDRTGTATKEISL